eukprot:10467997-Lingulodinium_polyedra.AAC.1
MAPTGPGPGTRSLSSTRHECSPSRVPWPAAARRNVGPVLPAARGPTAAPQLGHGHSPRPTACRA